MDVNKRYHSRHNLIRTTTIFINQYHNKPLFTHRTGFEVYAALQIQNQKLSSLIRTMTGNPGLV